MATLGQFDVTWASAPPEPFVDRRDMIGGKPFQRYGFVCPIPLFFPLIYVPLGAWARVDFIGHTSGAIVDSIAAGYFPLRLLANGNNGFVDHRAIVSLATNGRTFPQLTPWYTGTRTALGGTSFQLASNPPPGLVDVPVPLPPGLYAQGTVGLLYTLPRFDAWDNGVGPGPNGTNGEGEENSNTWVSNLGNIGHWTTTPVIGGSPNVVSYWDFLRCTLADSLWRLTGEFVDGLG